MRWSRRQGTRERQVGWYLWPTAHLNLAPVSEIMTSLCLILWSFTLRPSFFIIHFTFLTLFRFFLRFQCHVSPMACLDLHGTDHHIRYWSTHRDLDLIECRLEVSPRFQQTGLSKSETWLTRITDCIETATIAWTLDYLSLVSISLSNENTMKMKYQYFIKYLVHKTHQMVSSESQQFHGIMVYKSRLRNQQAFRKFPY